MTQQHATKKIYRPIPYIHVTLMCFLLLTLAINNAWAANAKKDKWYEIEVIIFANNDTQLLNEEKWPEKPGTPNTKNVLDLFTQTELLLDDVENLPMYYVEPSTPSENSLAPLVKRIESSDKYSILSHHTWRQIASRKKDVAPVLLEDTDINTLYQNPTPILWQPVDIESEITTEVSEDSFDSLNNVDNSNNLDNSDALGDIDSDTFDENNAVLLNDNEEAFQEENQEATAEQLLLEALLEEESILKQEEAEPPFFIHELDPIVPFDEIKDLPQPSPIALTPMGPPHHLLFGTFQFFKNRYLHIAVDFSYRPMINTDSQEVLIEDIFPMAKLEDLPQSINSAPLSDGLDFTHTALTTEADSTKRSLLLSPHLVLNSQEELPLMGFRLKGSKRIRLNEIHYFDHPIYGIIVRATPYIEPEVETEAEVETEIN